MTFLHSAYSSAYRALLGRRLGRRVPKRLAVGASLAVFGLAGVFAVVPPPPPTPADQLAAYIIKHSQKLTVSSQAISLQVEGADATRDSYSATAGIDTLVAGGTNYDWAKLVMMSGGWPQSEANVTVFTRWMRQENGSASWWNRNNPLNNGYGSGGGGGTGSYANLIVSAQKAAEMLKQNKGFATIVADFAASAPTAQTEAAIWASPWASGHYANGAHWHYTPVDVVKAPASAW